MDTRLPTAGLDLQLPELAIAQFLIPLGAGATYSMANNIATFTFNAAHGLTLSPAAGVPPNYFISFGGTATTLTGTGQLVGNIFRILTIPSTTAITFYCTIATATVTATTGIPVFFPPFTAGIGSPFQNGPSQVIATAGTYPLPNLTGALANYSLAANALVRYNPAQDAVILDAVSTPALAGGFTPVTAPTWRTLLAASSVGQVWGAPPWTAIWASGTTATSNVSVIA